jgi:transcriptional regulator with XRE-family HTH domain
MKAKAQEEPVDARVRRRLRELRTERGLTLQQVAARASIDLSTLSRLESGKRRLAIDHIPALAAPRLTPPDPLPVHEGHDWLYVLDGRLRLLLGSAELTIQTGEAVEFTTWTPQWFGAVDGPVELIGFFGPQGQKLHLHD